MSRKEYIEKLNELLADLPEEERSEAVSYYEDYFDDAGEENEAAVIADLKSPEDTARSIRAGLDQSGEISGFTEKGYEEFERKDVPGESYQTGDSENNTDDSEELRGWKKLSLPVRTAIIVCIVAVLLIVLIFIAFGNYSWVNHGSREVAEEDGYFDSGWTAADLIYQDDQETETAVFDKDDIQGIRVSIDCGSVAVVSRNDSDITREYGEPEEDVLVITSVNNPEENQQNVQTTVKDGILTVKEISNSKVADTEKNGVNIVICVPDFNELVELSCLDLETAEGEIVIDGIFSEADEINLSTDNGDVLITGDGNVYCDNDVTISVESGNVMADSSFVNIGAVRISVSAGNVSFQAPYVEGDMDIFVAAGDIDVSGGVYGNCTIRDNSGNVTSWVDCYGLTAIEVTDGNISYMGDSGSEASVGSVGLVLTADSGNVDLNLGMVYGDVNVNTSDGNVSLTMNSGNFDSCNYKLTTDGTITFPTADEIESHQSFAQKNGSDFPDITVSAGAGDITVYKQ